jgi:hypothetical protein
VGDWWRGTLSSRRLILLVKHLPDESATKRAMADDPWPASLHMLVSLFNELRVYRMEFIKANGSDAKLPLIPRPSEMSVSQEREQSRNVHDALLSMMQPAQDPELVDARERLFREMPQVPQTEVF